IRYGFGGLVAEMRIFPFFSVFERLFISKKKAKGRSVPLRLRLVLEELGPIFIKFGQIASTRADIFPPAWIDEFKVLQDAVPPFPYEEVRQVIEKSLHAPIEEKFRNFNPVPVASASIAQVHYAELPDGTPLAIKVKRPGIDRTIHSDISVMYTIAGLFERYVPQSKRYRPVEVVDEFARVIKNEQDLTVEGGYVNRFENLFKGNESIKIPHVYWDRTTEEVLTMERVEGTPIDEVDKIREMGLDVKDVAVRGLELFFQQVFEYGIFHADLHPGNIFVRDDGVIIYLDFGIVGRLDRSLRKYLASILYYLIKEDYYRMAVIHRDMGLIGADVDIHEFEDALRDISEPIFGRTLEHIHMSAMLMKLIETSRHFDMTLQPNLLLLQKSMVIIEGVGRQLYPDINMWEVARPLIVKWMMREKFSPKAVYERTSLAAEDLSGAIFELPQNINSLAAKALRDELKVSFAHHGIEEVTDGIERTGRRIGGGVVLASVLLSSTLAAVFSPDQAPALLGFPVLSLAGFFVAFLLALRLLFIPSRKGED
ncbi:MAG: 2-polyprenylphenol 6-hydroxylase, partial [Thermodesulfobacteriota bacterium]